MDIKIKARVELKVGGSALEDALAEYDELTVSDLIRQIIDKAIACEEIKTEVYEGPDTLEEYDSAQQESA